MLSKKLDGHYATKGPDDGRKMATVLSTGHPRIIVTLDIIRIAGE
jgi:predicted aspartyl protease